MRILKLSLIMLVIVLACAWSIRAQNPPVPIPAPVHLDCTSTSNPTLHVSADLDSDPVTAFRMLISNVTPASTDKTPPVVNDVLYTGGGSVLKNAVPIPLTATSVRFSVSATDDTGLQSFALYVDGFIAATGPALNYPHHLPNPFTVFWQDDTITPGAHSFRLIVYDAAANPSKEAVWQMTK